MKNFKFNRKRYGIYITYYKSGKIWQKCNYKNDILNGKYISYHENDNIWVKCYYKNNKRYMENILNIMKKVIL
jgi:antitoxin component YwqK of YwqJK toxin-antitoxin module